MIEFEGDEQNILARVLTRSAVDPEFRRRLLSDPGAAVAEVVGEAFPEGWRIRFIEQPADLDALIVLPRVIDDSSSPSD
ncbi:MAG: hypothetical protein ABIT20_17095 [Gemmatimonadaceae bacterium]